MEKSLRELSCCRPAAAATTLLFISLLLNSVGTTPGAALLTLYSTAIRLCRQAAVHSREADLAEGSRMVFDRDGWELEPLSTAAPVPDNERGATPVRGSPSQYA